ncbi:MAG: flagellar basal body P-ring formation protein FlgA [Gammaproteobacteria bacterium]|nr:flagellar basal body P-ring formation protein FlgA [Gammaproteobacteria bacterium]
MTSSLKKVVVSVVLLTGLGVVAPTLAETQSISSIAATAARVAQARAEGQGYERVSVAVRPIDARLRLTQCGSPLTVLPTVAKRALGQTSVGIRCSGPEPWTIYARATVSAIITVPTLNTSLSRGTLIGEGDITVTERSVTQDLVGFATRSVDIVGREIRRDMAAGQLLRSSDLVSPKIIERGQTVDLIAQAAGLSVNMQGKSLGRGGVGDRVLVKNLSSGKRVEGLVLASGSILVN